MNLLSKMKPRNEKKNPAAVMGIALFLMYAVSGILLLLLALCLFRLELEESAVRIGVAAVYCCSGFFGGFFIGKQMRDKKYLWGLFAGSLYFALLVIVSILVRPGMGETLEFDVVRIITTMILCSVSSMAGGMVS